MYNAPQITEDNKKELAIADEQGNVIFKLDKDGAHTTKLTLNGEEAASQKYVQEAIEDIDFPETDLTDYATKDDVKQAIDNIDFPETDLTNYPTKQDLQNAIDNIDFPETDLTGYATEGYVKEEIAGLVNSAPEALNTLGELAVAMKDHEDAYDALLETVGQKATSEQLQALEENFNEGAVSEGEECCIADKNGLAAFKVNKDGVTETANLKTKELTIGEKTLAEHLEDALQPYATSESVKKAIEEIDFPETDLSNYPTKEEVKKSIEEIDFPETDLTGYATEEYVRNKIAEAQLEGEEIDLSGYATKEDIKNFITEIPDNYVEEEELQSALDEVTKELNEHLTSEDEEFQIADDKGLVAFKVSKEGVTHVAVLKIGQEAEEAATKKYVEEAIGKIDFPETDLTEYATKEDVKQAIEEIDFPETDLSNYTTKEDVKKAIEEINFPETDLTGYATEEFVNDAIGKIEFPETDLTDYATKQYVEEQVGPKAAQTDLDLTNQELGKVKELVGTTSVEDQIEEALDNFETFSGDYNDLINAPDIAEDNSGDMAVADKDGNVAFKVDSEGRTHVTSLAIGGENLESILEKKATKEEITLTALGLTYGKSDLTPGVSPLPTGHFYFVYE